MNGDFADALQQIAREKEMSAEALLETVEQALVTAYKKNFAAQGGEIKVRINSSKPSLQVFCQKLVVEEEASPDEIALNAARQHDPDIMPGEVLEIEVTPTAFGRIAAQTAKQVVVQRLREAERDRIFEEYNQRVGEVVTGIVQRREHRNILVNIGKIEAVLPPSEQVPTEPYRFNDRLKVYIVEVRTAPKGPQVTVSRTHPSLIRRLFELEVPEIADGIAVIKSVAREPGARSKIAVHSRDEKVDPVGSCVGHRGSRVQAVVNELYDEKIDIIRWSPEADQFIAEALSPAKAVKVTTNEAAKSAFVMVPDTQLSLAIGKAGQNVRLAARLTGWRIDIRSESQVARAALIQATTPEEGEISTEEEAPLPQALAAEASAPAEAAAEAPGAAEAAAAAPAEAPALAVPSDGAEHAEDGGPAAPAGMPVEPTEGAGRAPV
ncbi:MAG: transcription termination/antitermination protein NusA [Chthonomonadales bacterium]|nr:transcription termination/antitermination protein NusA [Chthonomonadales bacterium]